MVASFELAIRPLINAHVRLEPIEERHRDGLCNIADDESIWRYIPFSIAEMGYTRWFDWLLHEQSGGRWFPFAVLRPNGEIVGQSCYIHPRPRDRCVEIGGTWYAPSVQGTRINPAAKLLLLELAFSCGAERVELKADAANLRSRRAIEKLGCAFEGVLRRHMLRPDGTWRDTAYYSLLREEWPDARRGLEHRLSLRHDTLTREDPRRAE